MGPEVGIDEVGWGAVAGPLLLVGCAIRKGAVQGVKDSKQLSPKRRHELAPRIREAAFTSIFVWRDPEAINRTSLEEAWESAVLEIVQKAQEKFGSHCSFVLDGTRVPSGLGGAALRAEAKADQSCYSVSAASVLAKAERDAHMATRALSFPGYGWERNAGYPTAAHRAACLRLGLSPLHRLGACGTWLGQRALQRGKEGLKGL